MDTLLTWILRIFIFLAVLFLGSYIFNTFLGGFYDEIIAVVRPSVQAGSSMLFNYSTAQLLNDYILIMLSLLFFRFFFIKRA